jgi:hypothetical protein
MSANPKKQHAIVDASPEASGFLALVAQDDGKSIAEVIRRNVGPGGITPADLERIKVPSGGQLAWTLEDDEVAKEFDGVILAQRDIRAYWRERYNGEHTPPDCYSQDAEVGVGNPGGSCADCPFSKFGTSVNEKGEAGKGQACALRRVLLILRPGNRLPIVLSVPPSSLKPVRNYLLRLSNKGTIFTDVTTTFGLIAEKSAGGIVYSQVLPRRGRDLTPAEGAALQEYVKAVIPAFEAVQVEREEAAQ